MKKLRSSDTSEFSLTLFHTYNFFPKETGEEGLEPPSTVLETAALPLNYSPMFFCFLFCSLERVL